MLEPSSGGNGIRLKNASERFTEMSVMQNEAMPFAKPNESEPALSAVEDDLVTCFESSVAVYSAANGVDAEQTSVEVTREYSDAETVAYRDALSDEARATYERFGLSPDAVADVCEVTYSYTANGEAYDYTCTLVKIGMQWYVDITTL